ncbi:MAG TPA: RdgB/HAM1 family non-canonical purine NTP pyrophosphatase [Candidatus Kapabacteria bacterium]|nr:RdgB/HAM1 family non-canonical purine NTP pyrophosphatase [Candidatus Kapabacteria bacterium]
MSLILATHNPHKREELREILRDELSNGVEILTLEDIQPTIGDIEETGSTLEENALIKARVVHKRTNLATVADDTGLEVEALGGAPGVYSARYSGEGATYASNVLKLLDALEGEDDRRAKFSTVIAYIDASGGEHLFRGEVSGVIAREPRGANGFGYDPIFIPEVGTKTFAEMTDEEKNAISHRGRALRAFAKYLRSV